MRRIETVEDFEAVENRGGVILITDSGTGDKVHHLPCPKVKARHFEEKVVTNRSKNGAYFELPGVNPLPGGATRCPDC